VLGQVLRLSHGAAAGEVLRRVRRGPEGREARLERPGGLRRVRELRRVRGVEVMGYVSGSG
jgi:hypothetical protein